MKQNFALPFVGIHMAELPAFDALGLANLKLSVVIFHHCNNTTNSMNSEKLVLN
jgi:hypothetical protein